MAPSPRRFLVPALCAALLAGTGPSAAHASGAASGTVQAPSPSSPSLIVLLVIDGLRHDDLEKWSPHFGPGGFRRLMEGGAVFNAARYPYATTMTCPGHATVSTGALPARHGIIANAWFDREANAKVSCVHDPASPTLGVEGSPGVSPRLLLAPTLSDQLLATRGASSRAVAVSLKDRAAVMLAGRRGQAFWWGDTGFTTSRHYAERLPAYVSAWNERRPRPEGGVWARFAGPEVYASLGADDDARERPAGGLGRVFPHPLTSTEGVLFSPFGAELLLDFSLAALRAEALGTRPGARDLLAVGMSTVDLVSHTFGPDSHEALDALLRLDRSLAAFLEALDRQVGLSRVLIAVTADHGMTPIPRTPAGRVEGTLVARTAETALDTAFGEADWVQAFTTPHLYLRRDTLQRRKVSPEAAARVCREALTALPGIAATVSAPDLTAHPTRELATAVRAEYVPARSGEVVVIPAPEVLLAPEEDNATVHGTPYEYDRHVPLLLFGQGVLAAHHARAVSPADLAPTLAAWLRVPLPDASGAPLQEALPPPPPRAGSPKARPAGSGRR